MHTTTRPSVLAQAPYHGRVSFHIEWELDRHGYGPDAVHRMIGQVQREDGITDYETAAVLLLSRWGAPLREQYAILATAVEERLAAAKAERVIAGRGHNTDNVINWDAYDRKHLNGKQARGEPSYQPAPPAETLPLPHVDMSTWDSEPVPQQQWAVSNRIPLLQAALFSGEGAAGKSTIELQLAAAHVLGRDWLGTMPKQGPALYIDAEDDPGVMHRRLAAITKHYGVTFADLIKNGLHLISLAGRDAVLATVSRGGKIEPTPLYKQILEAAGDIKPISIGIASSANVFAGNEIARNEVQQFVGLLTRLAIAANGSTKLLAHPSLSGIANDTGLSGNTQWHNAVRARFYLKGIKPEEGEEPDSDLREIVFKKNNYGPISESIVLRYTDGLFLPVPGVRSLDNIARQAKAGEVFLDLLHRFTKENRKVGSSSSRNYAPSLFAREEEAKRAGINSKALEAAMRQLFKDGRIWNEPCGKPSRPAFRLAIKA
jgi:RecA-family ATPase